MEKMKGFDICLNKSKGLDPASVEVSAQHEKHILEHIRKVVSISVRQLHSEKEIYTKNGSNMVRFILPNVSDDQLSQIAWFIGEWYSRVQSLLDTNLN